MALDLAFGLGVESIRKRSTVSYDTVLGNFAMSEFYVQPGAGSNLNAGSTTSATALATYVSSGGLGWNSGTGVFEVVSGNPVADGVTVGMFASIYVTSGATVATFVCRITAVSSTAVTVSLTACSGTPPSTDTAGLTTMKVGGAWAGPNGATGFPFNFIAATTKNISGNVPRVNFKNGTDYTGTAAWTHTLAGPTIFQGMTSTPGDGGRAVFKGPATGTSYSQLTVSGACCLIADMDCSQSGNSGTPANWLVITGARCLLFRVTTHDCYRRGHSMEAVHGCVECEAYNNNTSNTVSDGACYNATAGSHLTRLVSHNNRTGSNSHGLITDTSIYYYQCIFAYNTGHGVYDNGDTNKTYSDCDFYNNSLDGLSSQGGSQISLINIRNCNFIKNGQYGIRWRSFGHGGSVANCGFGTGTQANASGDTNTPTEPFYIRIHNNVFYAADVTPYSDPANGVFNLTLAAAVGTGDGGFTGTANGLSATVGYPDIGAADKRP